MISEGINFLSSYLLMNLNCLFKQPSFQGLEMLSSQLLTSLFNYDSFFGGESDLIKV